MQKPQAAIHKKTPCECACRLSVSLNLKVVHNYNTSPKGMHFQNNCGQNNVSMLARVMSTSLVQRVNPKSTCLEDKNCNP